MLLPFWAVSGFFVLLCAGDAGRAFFHKKNALKCPFFLSRELCALLSIRCEFFREFPQGLAAAPSDRWKNVFSSYQDRL